MRKWVITTGAILSAGLCVHGANIAWTNDIPTGDWNDVDSWMGISVPGSGDTAQFTNANATVVTMAPYTTNSVYTATFSGSSPEWITLAFDPTAALFSANNLSINGRNVRLASGALEVSGTRAYVGQTVPYSTLVVADGASFSGGADLYIGDGANAYSNVVVMIGSTNKFRESIHGLSGSHNTFALTNASFIVTNGTFYVSYYSTVERNNMSLRNSTVQAGAMALGNDGKNSHVVLTEQSQLLASGGVTLGNNGGAEGNSVILADSSLTAKTLTVGNSGKRNTLTVSTNSTLSVTGADISLTIGTYGSENKLVFDHGSATSVSTDMYIGDYAAASSNAIIVTESTLAYQDLMIGRSASYGALVMTNSTFTVHRVFYMAYSLHATSEYNTALLVNSTLDVAGNAYMSYGGKNNSVVLTDNSKLLVGEVLSIAGMNNSAFFTNSSFTAKQLLVGNASHNNTLVIGAGSTARVTGTAHIYIGNTGSSNTLIAADGGKILPNGGRITVGDSGSYNAMVLLDTHYEPNNLGEIWLSSMKGTYNTFAMTNATLTFTNVMSTYGFGVAYDATSCSNAVSLKDSALDVRVVDFGWGGKDNSLVLDNSRFTAVGTFRVGVNGTSTGNSVTLRGTNALIKANAITLNNDVALTMEIPRAGWTDAPIRTVAGNLTVSGAVKLYVEAKQCGLQGGGKIPLVYSANGTGLATLKAAAKFVTGDGDFEIDGNTLYARVRNEGATVILLR